MFVSMVEKGEQRMEYTTIKPFIKWAGGKSQLLDEIRKKYPLKMERYCEPFVGGGAVMLDVLANCKPREVMINDINKELVNTYKQVQRNIDELIAILEVLQEKFWKADTEERKIIYTSERNRFNELKFATDNKNNVELAALFIFLNKTCFNGLYRVNRDGLFNVPIGSYKFPPICDSENLRTISKLMKNVIIHCGNYSECYDFIDSQTFVYIDPPYRPLTVTSSFTSYSENKFGDNEQIELGKFVDKVSLKGATIVLSNSDPKNVDDKDEFFDDLYGKYNIQRVSAKRRINSKGDKRNNVNELLISNF